MVHRPILDQDLKQLSRGVTITTPIQRDRVNRLIRARTLPCEVSLGILILTERHYVYATKPDNLLDLLTRICVVFLNKSAAMSCPLFCTQVTRLSDQSFSIILKEGRNRQIRRMCEKLGYFVRDLHREQVMGIGLGGLREGMWKPLSRKEMEMIQSAIDQYHEQLQHQKVGGDDCDEEIEEEDDDEE